jgi:hypothetical protein
MQSLSVLPQSKSKKAATARLEERCCWCGVTRVRTTRAVPDSSHGPHEADPRSRVDVDVEDVPMCVERPAT